MADRLIMDADAMAEALASLANQVAERHLHNRDLVLVGIERRGADLARRLVPLLTGLGAAPALASLDINLYRDDWTRLAGGIPHIGPSSFSVSPNNRTVILVDDVLFSGRTARAALEGIMDYGRPDRVELLVLIDRGHRELPLCATYTGRRVETTREQHIDVLLRERDGRDAVILRG